MPFTHGDINAYITQVASRNYITQPGYEIHFFSRMDSKLKVPASGAQGYGGPVQGNPSVAPTFSLLSHSKDANQPLVQSIEVIQTTTDQGSSCKITLIEPHDGTTFFEPTLGNKSKGVTTPPDYDYSPDDTIHRIGPMDTVLIKLINHSPLNTGSNQQSRERETVFRGVVADIVRSKSVGGARIEIQMFDFGEFLRRSMAIRTGIFSTISLSVTGRGLVFNALNYTNHLLNGDKTVLGTVITQDEIDRAQAFVNNLVQGFSQSGLNPALQGITSDTSFDKHQMLVPPLFYLEYSSDSKLRDGEAAFGVPSYLNLVTELLSRLSTSAQAFMTGQPITSILPTTPEDKESIVGYQAAIVNTTAQISKTSTSASLAANVQSYQPSAWVLSDIFLEQGLIDFEHEYMWNLVTSTAARSFRECYFDFRPKLTAEPVNCTNTADVIEQRRNKSLVDVHPNIGVMKYRLSPALLPFTSETGDSLFWQYQFSDSDVIGYNSTETERGVFTAVLGYGNGFDPSKAIQNIFDLATSENKGFAFAQSVDPYVEQRLGYRFMTNHDAKLSIKVLAGLMTGVLLEKSQLSMFSANITIPGRPDIVPGSLVRLVDKRADYYCNQVQHSWSIDGGYHTQLGLVYGHTQGKLPQAFIGLNNYNSTSTSADVCAANHSVLQQFMNGQPQTIGSVDVGCFVEALWMLMTQGTQSNASLANFTKEAEETASKTATVGDWIPPLNQPYPAPYNWDGMILQAINLAGLQHYNVTLNTVKRIMFAESSFDQTQVRVEPDQRTSYGLFQMLFPAGATGDTVNDFGVTPKQCGGYGGANATNLQESANAAMRLLRVSMEHNGTSNNAGLNFLLGVAGYNQGQNSYLKSLYGDGLTYVNRVFGSTTVQAIQNGTLNPTNSQFPGSTIEPWPYYVYGPLGIRCHQADASITATPPATNDTNYQAMRKLLSTFDPGMKKSITYIVSILKKYQSSNIKVIGPNGDDQFGGMNLDGDLFTTAVAAWFSDETYDPNFKDKRVTLFGNTLNQLKQLYALCQKCKQSSSGYSTYAGYLNRGQFTNFLPPVDPAVNHITSGFGPRTVGSNPHPGIDIASNDGQPDNQPVYAAADGTVGYAGFDESFGNFIQIMHDKGYMTRYGDLGSLSVKTGDKVKQRQIIGVTGPGPNETGVHLHFEIRSGATGQALSQIGEALDPVAFLPPPLGNLVKKSTT